jgi:ElaB/YqjD/DUF883 family membrane-anchored ribosome-binding protein
MSLLDDLNKAFSGSVERVKFEARKLQRTTQLQGELFSLRQTLDTTVAQLGQRAFELYQQGRIAEPALVELAARLQQMHEAVAAKERELQQAQAEPFVEPQAPSAPAAQRVPIEEANAPLARACPSCGYLCPPTALFCANCGTRVAS